MKRRIRTHGEWMRRCGRGVAAALLIWTMTGMMVGCAPLSTRSVAYSSRAGAAMVLEGRRIAPNPPADAALIGGKVLKQMEPPLASNRIAGESWDLYIELDEAIDGPEGRGKVLRIQYNPAAAPDLGAWKVGQRVKVWMLPNGRMFDVRGEEMEKTEEEGKAEDK